MSKIIEISDDLYARLESEAKARAITLEELIREREREHEQAKERAFVMQLKAKGWVLAEEEPGSETPSDFQPIEVNGTSLSETIIEDRGPK